MISKTTIKRLVKDIKEIQKKPLTEHGIHYTHDENDILKGYALIIGPQETPYFGGYYFFEIFYPNDYPYNPPKVKFCTNAEQVRFNPNLYENGYVCISILNTWQGDQWSSCQTISSLLLSLVTLFINNPLINEPGVTMSVNHKDIHLYNQIIEYSNINIAFCDIILKKPNIYLHFFDLFENIIKENYTKNSPQILEIIKNNMEQPICILHLSHLYLNMKVLIDYPSLYQKYCACASLPSS
jgi:ubiquitin-protein ligase